MVTAQTLISLRLLSLPDEAGWWLSFPTDSRSLGPHMGNNLLLVRPPSRIDIHRQHKDKGTWVTGRLAVLFGAG